MSSRFRFEEARAEMPLPAKVTFEVEANLYTMSGWPALAHSERISGIWG